MNVSLEDLLQANVHLGHQLRRYNPQFKKFTYATRHGISIIDLEKTHARLQKACQYIEDLVADGKTILLVGTKKQAQEPIREAGEQCGMPVAANRWLGGMLTNFSTIKKSIAKYKHYLKLENDGSMAKLPKKEQAAIRREMNRMMRNFEGILNMEKLPDAAFIVDIKNELIAVAEMQRLKIPIVGLVDSNSDPCLVDYPIPGNDDASKSIRIIVEEITDAILRGLERRPGSSENDSKLVIPDTTKEEQLPVTVTAETKEGEAEATAEENAIPTSFSTDEGE